MISQAYFLEGISVEPRTQVMSADITMRSLIKNLDDFDLSNSVIDDVYIRFLDGNATAEVAFTVNVKAQYNITLCVTEFSGELVVKIISGTEEASFTILSAGLFELEAPVLEPGAYTLRIESEHDNTDIYSATKISLPKMVRKVWSGDNFSVHRRLVDFNEMEVRKVAASMGLSISKYNYFIYENGTLNEVNSLSEAVIKSTYVFINKSLFTTIGIVGCRSKYSIISKVEQYLQSTTGILSKRFVWQ